MTASPPAAPGIPSEEEIARWLCTREGLDPDIKASHEGNAPLWTESRAEARDLIDMFRPALEAKDADFRKLVLLLDKQMGTPCEQIRHEQEVEALQAKLAQAVEALEPFADEKNGVMQDLLWGDEPDTAVATITTRLGNIRAARAVVRSASADARGETR